MMGLMGVKRKCKEGVGHSGEDSVTLENVLMALAMEVRVCVPALVVFSFAAFLLLCIHVKQCLFSPI